MITKVTITGADDSVYPTDLLNLSIQYPFVEWGILVSQTQQGDFRFPSIKWMEELSNLKMISQQGEKLKLSCHFCGRYVREIMKGVSNFGNHIGFIWNKFDRVQLNFHGDKHFVFNEMFTLLRKFPEKEFIFQYDGVNNDILLRALAHEINCSALFDLSHGAGLLPSEWPNLLQEVKCGYAGGLSPENLVEQIKLIEEKAGEKEIWIDMETHVRSNMDMQFDLDKVRRCLEIAGRSVAVIG